MLKTFVCGHSCMMTFLHLKVHNDQCIFSIGSVSPSPYHCIPGSVSTCKHGYAENICVWIFMHDDLSALKSAEWLMQIFHWFSLPITMSLHPRFSFNMQRWLCLIHLCMDIHTWWPFCTWRCIMGNANFPLIQFPHHHITVSQVQFQHASMAMLKTFVCGHSCMMTSLHLKVQNGWCKFSIDSVSPSPYHCIPGSVSTCKHGYAENIYAWTFMHDDLSVLKSA